MVGRVRRRGRSTSRRHGACSGRSRAGRAGRAGSAQGRTSDGGPRSGRCPDRHEARPPACRPGCPRLPSRSTGRRRRRAGRSRTARSAGRASTTGQASCSRRRHAGQPPADARIVAAVNEERAAWLRERRSAVEAQYDLEAAEYDDDPYPVALHVAFIDRLLATCPPGGIVLDAPCGTGQYFPQVAASGRRVAGVDQSAGMLAQARQRGIAERLEHIGLQELAFEAAFDGAMTVDAMENVPPEDWPVVVANIRRALKPGGHYYLTLEEVVGRRRRGRVPGAPAERRCRPCAGRSIEGDVGRLPLLPGPGSGPRVARRGRLRAWSPRTPSGTTTGATATCSCAGTAERSFRRGFSRSVAARSRRRSSSMAASSCASRAARSAWGLTRRVRATMPLAPKTSVVTASTSIEGSTRPALAAPRPGSRSAAGGAARSRTAPGGSRSRTASSSAGSASRPAPSRSASASRSHSAWANAWSWRVTLPSPGDRGGQLEPVDEPRVAPQQRRAGSSACLSGKWL